MPPPRIFCDQPLRPGSILNLADQAATHVVRVLRLAAGDPIILFDGSGTDYAATLVSAGRQGVRAEVGPGTAVDRESPLPVMLLQGVSRGPRMDTVVQKATELGVATLVPVLAGRTVIRLDPERAAARVAHWRRVAASACEQCGRSIVPAVQPPATLEAALAGLPAGSTGLLLDPAGEQTLAPVLADARSVALAIGPEGGFTEAEHDLLRRRGFTGVRLGPRILRTETAPLAALAIIQYARGDLGPG